MAAFIEVGLDNDEKHPTRAPPEVYTAIERLFRAKDGVVRLLKIARAIIGAGLGMKRRDPQGGDDRPFYARDMPEELMMEATARILAGRRKWDLARVPDPFVFYGGVMGSLWTDFCAADKTRREHEAVKKGEEPFDWRTRRPPTPLELLIAKEEEEEFQQLWQDFEAEFADATRGDSLARRFLALTQSDVYDVEEQARLLGVTIDVMYDVRRRVRRTVERFLARRKR